MKLIAKIKSKYMKEITDRTKKVEYRQFGIDSIEFRDYETASVIGIKVEEVRLLSDENKEQVMRDHPDINWDKNKPIFALDLGEIEYGGGFGGGSCG